jgi:mRNA interferase MazF
VSRQRRPLIQRGDIWDADIPGVGIHPVVVVTRETAIPVLSSLLCVLITSSFHGHVAEVSVGQPQGLDHDSAANSDTIFTLPRQVLTLRRGHLDTAKLAELDAALTIALGLD